MRSQRSFLVLALLLGAIVSPHAQDVAPPDDIVVDGNTPLRLARQAQRKHLLGTVDVYNIALYSDGAIDLARLASSDMGKALRIDVTYEDDLHRRVALDWRRELLPRLEPQAVAHLQGSFAPLRRGDVVLIAYVPAKGTTVRVNKGVAVSAAHHDLMLAFLDHWLGDRPVSEEMKRSLLSGS